jgi:hypothetical protein
MAVKLSPRHSVTVIFCTTVATSLSGCGVSSDGTSSLSGTTSTAATVATFSSASTKSSTFAAYYRRSTSNTGASTATTPVAATSTTMSSTTPAPVTSTQPQVQVPSIVLVSTAVPNRLLIGSSAHYYEGKTDAARFGPLSQQAGMNTFRTDVQWWDIEISKGELRVPAYLANLEQAVNDAIARGDRPLLVLDYGNDFYDNRGFPISDAAQAGFVRFAEFVAKYFKGRVSQYEVWNEWNIGTGTPNGDPGSAADYARLLKKVYTVVKAVDPSIQVIAGATSQIPSDWITTMIGQAEGQYDGISVHPYNYSNGPVGRTPEAAMQSVNALNQLITQAAGKQVPLYLTEMGWPTHTGWNGADKDTAANFTARMNLLLNQMPNVKGIWWYDFQDDGTNTAEPEQNFGLMTTTYAPKPAYFAVRDTARLVTTATSVTKLNLCASLYAFRYGLPDGRATLAVWSSKGDVVNLNFASATPLEFLDVGSNVAASQVSAVAGSPYPVPAAERPKLITGNLSAATISAQCK